MLLLSLTLVAMPALADQPVKPRTNTKSNRVAASPDAAADPAVDSKPATPAPAAPAANPDGGMTTDHAINTKGTGATNHNGPVKAEPKD